MYDGDAYNLPKENVLVSKNDNKAMLVSFKNMEKHGWSDTCPYSVRAEESLVDFDLASYKPPPPVAAMCMQIERAAADMHFWLRT